MALGDWCIPVSWVVSQVTSVRKELSLPEERKKVQGLFLLGTHVLHFSGERANLYWQSELLRLVLGRE